MLILAVLYLILQIVVLRSFDSVEHRYAEQAIANVTQAIDAQLGLLDRSVADYAVWDDTYNFLRGERGSYIASNFTDSTFESNQLDLVIIADGSGVVQFQRILGPEGDLTPAEQDAVTAAIQRSGLMRQVDDDGPRHAALLTSQWPLMVSAHRVLHSDGAGPSDGLFLMGRWVDAELAAELSDRMHLDISFLRLDRALPADLPPAARALGQGAIEQLTVPIDTQHLGSYSLIRNSSGQPIVINQIRSDRPIWAAGRQTIMVTLAVFIGGGAAFIISITYLLDRIVLARLRRLTDGVRTIGAHQDLGQRVAIDGSDELSLLGQAINQTMAALERADNDRRRAEEQREELWHELVRSRRAFIATVSHELRTPLTPIRGYVDMMLQGVGGDLDVEQIDFVKAIQQNALRMERIVDDLMVVGQLEAGQVQLDRVPLDLTSIVRSVLTMLDRGLRDGQLTTRLTFADDLPEIDADPYRLEQILANLLSNAIKYTPPGGEISVEARPVDAQFVAVTVSDTGIGMSAEERERLFTPFYRTEGAIRQHIPGSGLGLSIVRSLVMLHGGDITATSTPGAGSAFQITLPIFQESRVAL